MRTKLGTIVLTAVVLGILITLVWLKATGTGISLVSKETSLGRLDQNVDRTTLIVSPDSRRVAYIAKRGTRQLVVIDGVEGKEYDEISVASVPRHAAMFSPDSQRVVYEAVRGIKRFLVVDGLEGKEYDVVHSPIFSPDSKRLAYVGGEFQKTDGIGNLRWSVVVDGVEGGEFREAGGGGGQIQGGLNPSGLIFSPDSKKLAYTVNASFAGSPLGSMIVVDGVAGKPSVMPTFFTFSPDSSRCAYVVTHRPEEDKIDFRMVVGDIEGKEYDLIDVPPGPVFSADGRRIAYLAALGGKKIPVIDGVEVGEYEGFVHGSLVFSPDSKRISFAAERAGKRFVVVDGVEGNAYEWVCPGTSIFSPDSRRLAYVANHGKRQFAVVDGIEGKEYDAIELDSLAFSPDSKRLAYVARRGERQFVVVGSVEEREYDELCALTFSVDSRRLAYLATRGKRQFAVIDGVEGREYDAFPLSARLVFDGKDSLHTVGERDNEVFRIEMQIVEKR